MSGWCLMTNEEKHKIIFDYKNWILGFINDVKEYSYLIDILFNTEFIFVDELAPMDINRIQDARDMVKRYLAEAEFPSESNISEASLNKEKVLLKRRPSVLEVLIALCLRAENYIGSDVYNPSDWFWLCLENLDIRVPDKDIFKPGMEDFIRQKLDNFMFRRYDSNGDGSMFPCDIYAEKNIDCRISELWDQFFWYISNTYF